MASADLLMAFALAAVGYAAVPGPGTVYIAAQLIMRDPGAALWGALGLHVGGYVIVFGAAAGLTVLFSAVPVIYEGLKLVGAGYLVWLGVRLIVHRSDAAATDRPDVCGKRHPDTFSKGVFVEILNPTTIVFYVAFLPQFVVPAGDLPVWAQFLVLGVLVNLIFSLGDLFTLLIAAKVKQRAASSALGRWILGWLGGSVLIGLGIRLAADRS